MVELKDKVTPEATLKQIGRSREKGNELAGARKKSASHSKSPGNAKSHRQAKGHVVSVYPGAEETVEDIVEDIVADRLRGPVK